MFKPKYYYSGSGVAMRKGGSHRTNKQIKTWLDNCGLTYHYEGRLELNDKKVGITVPYHDVDKWRELGWSIVKSVQNYNRQDFEFWQPKPTPTPLPQFHEGIKFDPRVAYSMDDFLTLFEQRIHWLNGVDKYYFQNSDFERGWIEFTYDGYEVNIVGERFSDIFSFKHWVNRQLTAYKEQVYNAN